MMRAGLAKVIRAVVVGAVSASPAAAHVWCSPQPPAKALSGVASTSRKARGALIVFEGVDRAGKTTQANKLVESLNAQGTTARFMRFPGKIDLNRPIRPSPQTRTRPADHSPAAPRACTADRSTSIGKMIDAYLTNATEIDDRCVHLLFSANRWEAAAEIRAAISRGETVVVDRYAYSGVAFSLAKHVDGMDAPWCAAPDAGLPQPDKVLFLTIPAKRAQARGGFGEERYERSEFQERVLAAFGVIRAGFGAGTRVDGSAGIWDDVDAVGTIDEVADRVMAAARPALAEAAAGAPLRRLWGDDGGDARR